MDYYCIFNKCCNFKKKCTIGYLCLQLGVYVVSYLKFTYICMIYLKSILLVLNS